MAHPRLGLWVVLLVLFLPEFVLGQDDRPMLRFNFERQNEFTHMTTLDGWYALDTGKYALDMRVSHSNIYNNSLESENFVQIYLRTSIWQYYRIKDRLKAASWIDTDMYFTSANRKISTYGGVVWQPTDFLEIRPMVGYSWDVRTAVFGSAVPRAQLDQGISPALFILSEKSWPDDLIMQTRVFARYKELDLRQQINAQLTHSWVKKFEEGVNLVAGVDAGSHELDDYQANSIKRIISDTISPFVNLSYQFAPGLEWRSTNTFMMNRRLFRYKSVFGLQQDDNDLTFDGLEINTSQRLLYNRPKTRAFVDYTYTYTSRTYELENDIGLNVLDYEERYNREKEKDFIKNIYQTELYFQTMTGKKHDLKFNMVNRYLQYDSPSEENYDDRDELSWIGSLLWTYRFNRNFYSAVELSANYRHYAFLYGEKSQDNYIQRSLRLDYQYGWNIGKSLRLEGDNAVYVTYNVKDFTDYNKTDRATRNLETNIKGAWQPSRRFKAEAGFRRKEMQRGYLNWDAFTETTLDTNTIITIHNNYRYYFPSKNKSSSWFVDAGYKHFQQGKKQKANLVDYQGFFKTVFMYQVNYQTGPLISLGFQDKRQSTIDFTVWGQFHLQKSRWSNLPTPGIYQITFYEDQIRSFEPRFRPYTTIRLNYFFR